MSSILPTVSVRGVLATTRTLFVLLGSLLVPLLAQHLFGPFVEPAVVSVFVAAAAIVAARLARSAISEGGALRIIPLGAVGGLGAGVVSSLVWSFIWRPQARDGLLAAPIFGAIYGIAVGSGMSCLFALWSQRARSALAAPSSVAAHRLTIEAGLALALTGAVSFALYRSPSLRTAALALGFVGTVVIVVGTVRMLRLSRLFAEISRPDGGYQVIERTADTQAPAVAWVTPLDHVVVHHSEAHHVEPGAFRAGTAFTDVALVPGDLALVHRAIGRTVAFGFAALGASMLIYSGITVMSVMCCGSAPCGECSH